MSTAAPIVVIAPDSLKGSCSSARAASAIADGVRSVFGDAVVTRELPMADGGEGTLDALVTAWRGRVEEVETTDALGRARLGRIGVGSATASGLAGSATRRRAIIEAADANGLPAVSDVPLRPLDADSAGVGRLVLGALDAGAEEILLCVGGSATNDGGAGMLRVLGARLLDADGEEVGAGARGLSRLHEIDLSQLDPRLRGVTWRIACDVENPLIGPRGAAAVFGPQKGATPADIKVIDAALERLATLLVSALPAANGHSNPIEDPVSPDVATLMRLPGIGAAGGLPLGPAMIFGAELIPGAELVGRAVGLRAALDGAAVVITGEGRLDAQSLSGKVVSRVLADAGQGTPVVVLAGSVALSAAETRAAGIAAAVSIASGPAALAELRDDAAHLLGEAAAQLCGLLAAMGALPRSR